MMRKEEEVDVVVTEALLAQTVVVRTSVSLAKEMEKIDERGKDEANSPFYFTNMKKLF